MMLGRFVLDDGTHVTVERDDITVFTFKNELGEIVCGPSVAKLMGTLADQYRERNPFNPLALERVLREALERAIAERAE